MGFSSSSNDGVFELPHREVPTNTHSHTEQARAMQIFGKCKVQSAKRKKDDRWQQGAP
jgi:hypothetical protein